MFDDVKIYGDRPVGRSLFVVCDSIYYRKFYKNLVRTYSENLTGFDGIHCHIIRNENDDVSFEFDGINQTISYEYISDVERAIEGFKFRKKHWGCIESKLVKEMLVFEAFRKSKLKTFLLKALLHASRPLRDKIIDALTPLNFINNSQLKVYYSVRRFLMPKDFFSNVKSLLIVDVDSYFPGKFDFSQIHGPSSLAIFRSGMWSNCMAGFVYFSFESIGASTSLSKINFLLSQIIRNQGFHWGVDQLALDLLARENMLFPIKDFSFSFKPISEEEPIFVSLKGEQKWEKLN